MKDLGVDAAASPFPSQLELLSASSALKRFCEGKLEPSEIKALVVAAEAHHDLLAALKIFIRIREWNHDEAHDARREYDGAVIVASAVIAKAEAR